MNEELIAVAEFIFKHTEELNKLSQGNFMTFICMTMEEYCKANKLDITEMAQTVSDAVEGVNAVFGKY